MATQLAGLAVAVIGMMRMDASRQVLPLAARRRKFPVLMTVLSGVPLWMASPRKKSSLNTRSG